MYNFKLTTPVHQGNIDLKTAVAIANSNVEHGYDKVVTALVSSLHSRQGVTYPDIDFTSIVNDLAMLPTVNRGEVLCSFLVNVLYPEVFRKHSEMTDFVVKFEEVEIFDSPEAVELYKTAYATGNDVFAALVNKWQQDLKPLSRARNELTAAEIVLGTAEKKFAAAVEQGDDKAIASAKGAVTVAGKKVVAIQERIVPLEEAFNATQGEMKRVRMLEASIRYLQVLISFQDEDVNLESFEQARSLAHSIGQLAGWNMDQFINTSLFACELTK